MSNSCLVEMNEKIGSELHIAVLVSIRTTHQFEQQRDSSLKIRAQRETSVFQHSRLQEDLYFYLIAVCSAAHYFSFIRITYRPFCPMRFRCRYLGQPQARQLVHRE